MGVVPACDLGGTGMRAALVDGNGNVLVERVEAAAPMKEQIDH